MSSIYTEAICTEPIANIKTEVTWDNVDCWVSKQDPTFITSKRIGLIRTDSVAIPGTVFTLSLLTPQVLTLLLVLHYLDSAITCLAAGATLSWLWKYSPCCWFHIILTTHKYSPCSWLLVFTWLCIISTSSFLTSPYSNLFCLHLTWLLDSGS